MGLEDNTTVTAFVTASGEAVEFVIREFTISDRQAEAWARGLRAVGVDLGSLAKVIKEAEEAVAACLGEIVMELINIGYRKGVRADGAGGKNAVEGVHDG